jgi:ribosomal protein S18 acetylase RimI-like enzyme
MAQIAIAGPERIDELRPLWLELHHHHQAVSLVQPFVDDETSWAARRRSYVATFDHGGFALVAEEDGALAGYAMVRLHEGPDDSWAFEQRYAEVWTLVVAERARGRGIGSALLDAVDAELARRGIHDLVIGVMEGNDDARRLYERRGLVPGWVQLYRVSAAGRGRTHKCGIVGGGMGRRGGTSTRVELAAHMAGKSTPARATATAPQAAARRRRNASALTARCNPRTASSSSSETPRSSSIRRSRRYSDWRSRCSARAA